VSAAVRALAVSLLDDAAAMGTSTYDIYESGPAMSRKLGPTVSPVVGTVTLSWYSPE
jgi:hypothetical protein